jgi:hypothetical protein
MITLEKIQDAVLAHYDGVYSLEARKPEQLADWVLFLLGFVEKAETSATLKQSFPLTPDTTGSPNG